MSPCGSNPFQETMIKGGFPPPSHKQSAEGGSGQIPHMALGLNLRLGTVCNGIEL